MTKKTSQPVVSSTERPPIVAVLGHIDHGKTTLLDFIRKTAVAAKESGGITQHIGAYEIEHTLPDGTKKRITFLDTPGHEAFSKMRSRGANVADIAILVVAADEGAKPQTFEALEQIQASGATLIVAINKIDKPEAKPEKIKQQLAEKGVMLEGWGGQISNQEISAKTGAGIPDLLSLVLLTAELEEFKANTQEEAKGVVIEAHKNARIGIVATLIIKTGTLHRGDFIVAGNAVGKLKTVALSDGSTADSATFSSPVVVTGFESLPEVGEEFHITSDKKKAESLAAQFKATAQQPAVVEKEIQEGKPTLNVILKADTSGTKEALEKIIGGLVFPAAEVNVVKSEVGEITDNDISLAQSVNAFIAAFKVKMPPNIAKLVQSGEIRATQADIIYELVDAVKDALRALTPPVIVRHDLGTLSVLATFKIEKTRMIAGGKVTSGKMKKGAKADVKRKDVVVMTGKITQLQHNKEDIPELSSGSECGFMFVPVAPSEKRIEAGDQLEIYEEEIKPGSLE